MSRDGVGVLRVNGFERGGRFESLNLNMSGICERGGGRFESFKFKYERMKGFERGGGPAVLAYV